MDCTVLTRERGMPGDTVFLTGHPRDAALKRIVADEILEAYDCRVLLSGGEETAAERSALRQALTECGLVVFCATERFFEEENAARELALPLAKEERLLILPIAETEDVAEVCRSAFGSFPLVRGEPAYAFKLRAYIEDVVDVYGAPSIGHEAAARRRRLFPLHMAFVWAEEDEPLARHMARWFQAREDTQDLALRSGPPEALPDLTDETDLLFALITPRLLAREGALERLKDVEKPLFAILPEADCTDVLLTRWPEVRGRILTADPAALHRTIAIWRERMGMPYRETTALDRYLLGQAYQAGRGTQRDMARARELYLSSAEDGCPWAMLRLGCDPAEERRMHWLRGATAGLGALLYDISPRAAEATAIGRGLAVAEEYIIAERLAEARYEEAREGVDCMAEAVGFLRQVGESSERFQMSGVYARYGDISTAQGDLAGAERWYRQAEVLLRSAGRSRLDRLARACLLNALSMVYERAYEETASGGALSRLRDTLNEALDEFMEIDQARDYRLWSTCAGLCNRILKAGILCEEQPDGAGDALWLYDRARQALGELRQRVAQPIIDEQYGTILCYRALAEAQAPDRSLLYEAHRVFKALTDRFPHSAELRGKLEYVTHCLEIWPRQP